MDARVLVNGGTVGFSRWWDERSEGLKVQLLIKY